MPPYWLVMSALFLASCLPTPAIAKCAAVGWLTTSSVVGLGPQGSSSGLKLYDANGKQVGSSKSNPCSDLVYVTGGGMSFPYASTCNINKFEECHGAWGSDTHIDGDPPTDGNDFYGVGISTASECKVEFDC